MLTFLDRGRKCYGVSVATSIEYSIVLGGSVQCHVDLVSAYAMFLGEA